MLSQILASLVVISPPPNVVQAPYYVDGNQITHFCFVEWEAGQVEILDFCESNSPLIPQEDTGVSVPRPSKEERTKPTVGMIELDEAGLERLINLYNQKLCKEVESQAVRMDVVAISEAQKVVRGELYKLMNNQLMNIMTPQGRYYGADFINDFAKEFSAMQPEDCR